MIALLFNRLGPYHLARLEAAGLLMKLTCLEVFTSDETYAWDVVEGAEHFDRVRLFTAGEKSAQIPRREIIRRVSAALDKLNPEVVVAPGWSDSIALGALQWCLQKRRPAIVMSETTAFDAPRRAYKEAIKRRIVAKFSAGLVGGFPHRAYLLELGMDPERIFTGYDVVDNAYFEKGAAVVRANTESIRGRIGLPTRFFLASNRFVEKKNLERLLEAFGRYFHETGTNAWSLVLLGDGPQRSKLEEQSKNMGLDKSILMPGFKQYADLPAYYALASGFLHASTTEQWGLVVNEAMACGLPVLVSNRCGCALNLVAEGHNGWTFDPYDVQAITEALKRLSASSEQERAAMGQASRQLIAAWSPEAFAQGLKNAVNAALSSPEPKGSLFDKLLLRILAMR